jgi:hypothetical protein
MDLMQVKPKIATIDVDNVGTFHVREITGADVAWVAEAKGSRTLARLLVATLCNEDGSFLYKRNDADKLDRELPFSVLSAVAEKAQVACGLPNDVDELEKN